MINSQVERASHESAQVGIGERPAHLLLCGHSASYNAPWAELIPALVALSGG